jgi:hypothetical protein
MMRVVSTNSATCWTLPLHSNATTLQRATATAKPTPANFVRSLLLKGLRTCLGTLMIPSILLGTQAGDAWDWEFSYDRVSNAKSVTYVVEQTNARRFSEDTIDYWCPTDNGAEARITQLFAFTNTIQHARLSVQYIYTANLSPSTRGRASLWGSRNGIHWVRLANAPTPTVAAHGADYEGPLPDSLLGGRELWIQARLFTEGWNILSQFLRSDRQIDRPGCFELKVDLAGTDPSDDSRIPNTRPRRAMAQATLAEGTLQGITLLDGGRGYATPPVVKLINAAGATVEAKASVLEGEVAAIQVPGQKQPLALPVRVYISAPPYIQLPTIPGQIYQLYSSTNLLEWQPAGDAFTATESFVIQEYDTDQTGRFYQICHLADLTLPE